MSKRKTSPPRPPTYQGAGFLCRFTRIYDECLRQLAEDEPTDGHPALRRAGQAASQQTRRKGGVE